MYMHFYAKIFNNFYEQKARTQLECFVRAIGTYQCQKTFWVWEVAVPNGGRHGEILKILDTPALSEGHFYAKFLQILSRFWTNFKNSID